MKYTFFSLTEILLTQLWFGYKWFRSPARVALIAGSIYSRHPECVLLILDEIIDRTACVVDHRSVGPHIGASESALHDVVCDLATTVRRRCWPGEADRGRRDVPDDGSTGWCGSACKRRERDWNFLDHFFSLTELYSIIKNKITYWCFEYNESVVQYWKYQYIS